MSDSVTSSRSSLDPVPLAASMSFDFSFFQLALPGQLIPVAQLCRLIKVVVSLPPREYLHIDDVVDLLLQVATVSPEIPFSACRSALRPPAPLCCRRSRSQRFRAPGAGVGFLCGNHSSIPVCRDPTTDLVSLFGLEDDLRLA